MPAVFHRGTEEVNGPQPKIWFRCAAWEWNTCTRRLEWSNYSFMDLYRQSREFQSMFRVALKSREGRLASVVLAVRVPLRTEL